MSYFGKKNDKIMNDAKDEHVAVNVIYADSSNNLFYDELHTASKAVSATDCLELFVKGVICKKGTSYYAAVSCSADGTIDFGLGE